MNNSTVHKPLHNPELVSWVVKHAPLATAKPRKLKLSKATKARAVVVEDDSVLKLHETVQKAVLQTANSATESTEPEMTGQAGADLMDKRAELLSEISENKASSTNYEAPTEPKEGRVADTGEELGEPTTRDTFASEESIAPEEQPDIPDAKVEELNFDGAEINLKFGSDKSGEDTMEENKKKQTKLHRLRRSIRSTKGRFSISNFSSKPDKT